MMVIGLLFVVAYVVQHAAGNQPLFIGCFLYPDDTSGIEYGRYIPRNLSTSKCSSECQMNLNMTSSFALYENICLCSEDEENFKLTGKVDDGRCRYNCTNSLIHTEYCGSSDTIAVYTVNYVVNTSLKCDPLPNPVHGSITYEGSAVRFECYDGYVISGASYLTCQQLNSSWIWNGAVPKCLDNADLILPVMCDTLSKPAHGDVIYEESTAHFKCDEHYVLSGSERLTCQHVKGSWIWSEFPPFCLAVNVTVSPPLMCDSLTILVNGNISYEDSVARFKCHDGYVMSGTSRLTCHLVNSSWMWNGLLPYCQDRTGKRKIFFPLELEFSLTTIVLLAVIFGAVISSICCYKRRQMTQRNHFSATNKMEEDHFSATNKMEEDHVYDRNIVHGKLGNHSLPFHGIRNEHTKQEAKASLRYDNLYTTEVACSPSDQALPYYLSYYGQNDKDIDSSRSSVGYSLYSLNVYEDVDIAT